MNCLLVTNTSSIKSNEITMQFSLLKSVAFASGICSALLASMGIGSEGICYSVYNSHTCDEHIWGHEGACEDWCNADLECVGADGALTFDLQWNHLIDKKIEEWVEEYNDGTSYYANFTQSDVFCGYIYRCNYSCAYGANGPECVMGQESDVYETTYTGVGICPHGGGVEP